MAFSSGFFEAAALFLALFLLAPLFLLVFFEVALFLPLFLDASFLLAPLFFPSFLEAAAGSLVTSKPSSQVDLPSISPAPAFWLAAVDD